ncbi:hypothetical protein SAMD00019534_044690 [Acytostelium subglobosum LB1]|uniref:hypothetical protein n=1 Tax=Acytostelium subglobosum LB1 TaxID=1410327 RepID=UPI000644C9CF|nr:hypothetical protein SAMD00019534_044690 [Acytostelium subglobosum LB1]GAM21294.1 hypothetical protein SAMD00019534_044690 [Acytostelium subglobosum LB1]|eukprot:XP_012755413.1 hypothetical protein SAMD00019534_044690 [Acytostelium subglobosum LB1]
MTITNIYLPVTSSFAGVLGLFYVYLSLNVVRYRRGLKVSVGDGTAELMREMAKSDNNKEIDFKKYKGLVAAIRSHGNFAEFVPLQLVLAALLELQGVSSSKLTVLLGLFTVSRVIHPFFGMFKSNFVGWGRVLGTVVTFFTIAGSAMANIYIARTRLY